MGQPGNYIDFSDIPNQIYRSVRSRTWQFNLMLVGESGIGKSTLVKSLFKGKINPNETFSANDESVIDGINEYEALLEENYVKLKLRCIETSGFCADYFDRQCFKSFVDYIEKQFEKFLVAECKQARHEIEDNRVHCCIYMVRPTGKHLRQVDIDCMLALHDKVNLLPVIANADHLTPERLKQFKEILSADLAEHNISYYKFSLDEKGDEETYKRTKQHASKFPFAIIAADTCELVDRDQHRWLRRMPWGVIDIGNNEHCDFEALSKLLIRLGMLDLMDNTHCEHYAKYKTHVLDTADPTKLQLLGLDFYNRQTLTNGSSKSASTNGSSLQMRRFKQIDVNQERNEWERELEQLRLKLRDTQLQYDRETVDMEKFKDPLGHGRKGDTIQSKTSVVDGNGMKKTNSKKKLRHFF